MKQWGAGCGVGKKVHGPATDRRRRPPGPNPSKRVDKTASVLLYNFIESALLPATGQPAPPLTALLRRLRSAAAAVATADAVVGSRTRPIKLRRADMSSALKTLKFGLRPLDCSPQRNRVAQDGERWRRSGARTTSLLFVGCHGLPAMLMCGKAALTVSNFLWHVSRISHAQVQSQVQAHQRPLSFYTRATRHPHPAHDEAHCRAAPATAAASGEPGGRPRGGACCRSRPER